MKKWLFLFFLLAALAGGGWWWLKREHGTALQYETAAVTHGPMTQIVTASGALNPVINVTVGSQISGIIQKLFADYNSPVKAGQVVAQIDPATYQAVVHQMEGELANARAALELAQLTAARKKELVAQNASTKADLDTAMATLHQAEGTVLVKQANLEKANVDLNRCTIYSPIDGIVISRSVDVGQTVAATMNAPVLFTIANDLAKMQIDADVAEADVGNVAVEQTVDFTVDAFPYRTFHGTVIQVRNAAKTVQNVVTYDVVISVTNDDLKLKPGMTANVSIVVAQREDALKLSNAALRFRPPDEQVKTTPVAIRAAGPGGRRGGKPGGGRASRERTVYVLSAAGKPEPVPVKLGINDGIATEVLEGLKDGDVVITGMTAAPAKTGSAAPMNPLSGGGRRF
ncbi:MAG: efflux RND transporter periplasmic adaptor subunit [Chthoniobacter sp.]|nr:efflux RND transporter periplasmic adaptor subunit [Chthoniobacter sp.]